MENEIAFFLQFNVLRLSDTLIALNQPEDFNNRIVLGF